MDATKVRELDAAALKAEELKAQEQIFRLRFQLKLGQTEGVKKLRGLKRDIARFKTIERERALGVRGTPATAVVVAPAGKATKTNKGAKTPAAKGSAKS